MKSALVILLFVTAFFINMLANKAYKYAINWDKAGYYLYLPAVFINHDLAHLAFYERVDAEYQPTGNLKWYGIFKDSVTQKRYNKYPAGVAILEAPFFLVANTYCLATGTPRLYGYSEPYHLAICLAAAFWLVLGLFYLRRLLLHYYSDGVVAACLALIIFGTNLWYYSMLDMGMSHPFSFGLCCMLLYCTDAWYRTLKPNYTIIIALLLGLITLTRPSNVIIALIPLFWPARKMAINRLTFFRVQYRYLLSGLALFFALVMVQCTYWHYTTGHWLINSYVGEPGFDFAHPHILDGLTSYDKGWFVYTPVALLCVAGLVPLWKKHRQLAMVILLFMLVNLYVVFSWSFWQYGGGFSARPLIESYAVLCFPLAALVQWVSTKKLLLKITATVIFAAFITLNIFQSWQVQNHILPGLWITRQEYWKDFGQVTPVP